jgi:hypothetical protein
VSIDDIFGAIGVIGRVTNTSVTALASAFRLRRVTITQGGNAAGNIENAAILWFSANSDQEPDYEVIAPAPTTASLMQQVTSTPPRKSTAGFWYRNVISPATTTVFSLAISNAYSIIDVDLDFCLPTSVVSSQAITVSTAVVGQFYRLALNKANGSSTMIPIGYTTTT